MTILPDLLKQITVTGPFWSAQVEIVELADPHKHRALRNLFLDTTPRQVASVDQVFVPGTFIALCLVQQVRITPRTGVTYRWERPANAPRPALASYEDMQASLRSGAVSLLLLQANPEQWPAQATGSPPPCTCLAGDIGLDNLTAQSNARTNLYQALTLQDALPSDPLPQERPGAARLPGTVSVHSSGVSIYGRIGLPWELESARITAVLQLARVLPTPGGAEPGFRLTVELDRLTDAEEAHLIAAWLRLSQYLNPRYPLNGPASAAPIPTPNWVTLEIANPQAAPQMYWPIVTWQATPGELPLRFERGELNLLLSDRQPYGTDQPPTSLARVLPETVTIARTSAGLQIDTAIGAPPTTAQGTLSYTAQVSGEATVRTWQESFTLSDLDTAFNPIQTPQRLREDQNLPIPEWDPGDDAVPIDPPVLWGFMPLEDGWAQLPIPNLTEQMYLDAQLAQFDTPPAASFVQGAVAFGNSQVEALQLNPSEQPWRITLTDARALNGTWTLVPAGANGGFTLDRVTLTILSPNVIINGLLWLSTGRPTVADALPDFDNWTDGLRSIPLQSVRSDTDLFPSPVTIRLEALAFSYRAQPSRPSDGAQLSAPSTILPSALLGAWTLAYRENSALLARMVETLKLLPRDTFSRHLPLVWRRHPALPMIQALPLTQSQSPPNYPNASRQLAPFELTVANGSGQAIAVPRNWRFGVTVENGAATWSHLLTQVGPNRDWLERADLPLAALSLPGLVIDPRALSGVIEEAPAPTTVLPLQYRFDLPYTDEIQALAQLPRVPRDPSQVSPLPAEPPPEQPEPLQRETFGAHWQRLSEQATLASADATAALSRRARLRFVQHLIEPFFWPMRPTAHLAAYPGRLTLVDGGQELVLEGATALRGISGTFSENADNQTLRLGTDTAANGNLYQVEAGSMAAQPDARRSLRNQRTYRDQRGLLRAASTRRANLIATPVQLHASAGNTSAYELTSSLAAWSLRISEAQVWQFWFRDLPVNMATSTFERNRSPRAEDVNDPEALSREYNYLSGYEWRIGDTNAPQTGYLPLYGLRFYPLTLEQVQFADDQVTRVQVIGRLQLPLEGPPGELADLNNAVRVNFQRVGDQLVLAAASEAEGDEALALVSPEADWPLAMASGEITDAPRINWKAIRFNADQKRIEITRAQLHFFLFDMEWRLPLSAQEPLVFTPQPTNLTLTYTFPAENGPAPLMPREVALELDLTTFQHRVALLLDIKLGRAITTSAATGSTSERIAFTASARFPILNAGTDVTWVAGYLFDTAMELVHAEHADQRTLLSTERALQFTWSAFQLRERDTLQLLPGMRLRPPEAPGFATLTFSVLTDSNGIPRLQLQTAFVEALLFCRWGQFLQEPSAGLDQDRLQQQVFGSSAGELAFGYTAQWQGDTWEETFLLNGFLEVKSLISWPLALQYDPAQATLTLPIARIDGTPLPLAHTRHTMRVLLNQQFIPPALLLEGHDDALFQLSPERPWQLLAVAEHQLVDITPGPDRLTRGAERRWTVVQEVRLLHPTRMQQLLETYGAGNASTIDPVNGIGPITTVSDGYFRTGLREELIAALEQLPPDMLLVEASAPHWIRRTPSQVANPTILQFLPGGNQLAILSSPDDHAPSDPHDPAWLLLATPCLGRLQNEDRDGLDGGGTGTVVPLQIDPIRYLEQQLSSVPATEPLSRLALALTNWADSQPIRMIVANFDTAMGRTWARLDPLTLEESWFRLQTPLTEPQPERLQSVMAALPDTPARQSRSVALRRAFDVFRPAYPPAELPEYQVPAEVERPDIVWRQNSLLVNSRVQEDGLQVLYTFTENSGTTIHDVSGVGTPLNLEIRDKNAREWLPGGGLRITSSTIAESSTPATKLINACRATNEITIEVWITPKTTTLKGPARIVTLSHDTSNRNFTLSQGWGEDPPASLCEVRLRTTRLSRAKQGKPALITAANSLTTRLTHVVYTRNANGQARIYINGQRQPVALIDRNFPNPRDFTDGDMRIDGDFSNWDTGYRLALANEITRNRAWSGVYHMVAIYNRALSPARVARRYAQGIGAGQTEAVYGWHTTGLVLHTSGLLARDGATSATTLQRYAAATLLPARLQIEVHQNGTSEVRSNPVPLSFAVSPYLGLEFRAAPAAESLRLRLVSAELLCLERTSGALLPVASRIWELPDQVAGDRNQYVRDLTMPWARETHTLLAPDSPIAVLRFREINENTAEESATQVPLTTGYSFALVEQQPAAYKLAQRVARLRSTVTELRFREGQYGGSAIPTTIRPFEIAPPQITGVQPLYLEDRPETPGAWPWGLSALRLSVQYSQEQQGIIGSLQGANGAESDTLALWWQAPQHNVQYRSTLNTSTSAAGLPARFRAVAIKSLLPVLPNPPLPAIDAQSLVGATASPLHRWQPVLPGVMRYLISGARAGVMFAIRNQLLRQSFNDAVEGAVMVSGSVPVQHRFPRPALLPANAPADQRRQAQALQTWASFFEPDRNLLASTNPVDEAFLAACGAAPARRLQMQLVSPLRGRITADWNGELVFAGETDEWNIQIAVIAAGNWIEYDPVAGTPATFEPKAAQRQALQDLLARNVPGDRLIAQARVRHKQATDNFDQILAFPLLLADDTRLPLPLEPYFIHFEDPEYNRRLASQTANASGIVQEGQTAHTVTLATDRREYNPDSLLALRYDWDDNRSDTAVLTLQRVDANGIITPLLQGEAVSAGTLKPIALDELRTARNSTFTTGEALILRLAISVGASTSQIELRVDIVAEPVIPVPEAAYALLRRQTINGRQQVECVRFAWGPNPSRIELVCPEDLRQEVVRRRAVFQWRDAARPGTVTRYAIQKIAQSGATHFPAVDELGV